MPATSTILLTAASLSAAIRPLELYAYREPGCSGGEGGEGGESGEGGGGGGDGGNGGEGGDDGGWYCTTKDLVPWLTPGNEKLCPKPGAAHSAPSQPSPYEYVSADESVMSRVHVAPIATANGALEVYGAPPLSVVPSEQLRLQPTSLGRDPPEQVITEEMVGGEGAEGGEGGGKGGKGGGDG